MALGVELGVGVAVGSGVLVGLGVLEGEGVAVGVGVTPQAARAKPTEDVPQILRNSRRVKSFIFPSGYFACDAILK